MWLDLGVESGYLNHISFANLTSLSSTIHQKAFWLHHQELPITQILELNYRTKIKFLIELLVLLVQCRQW
jgi:hypothetical protein